MPLLSPILSRSVILMALFFGLFAFIWAPEVAPEKRARLEIRGLISELFLLEGLEGRRSLQELQQEHGPGNWSAKSPRTTEAGSWFFNVGEHQNELFIHLKNIGAKLPSDAPEQAWLDLIDQTYLRGVREPGQVGRPIPDHVPEWLRDTVRLWPTRPEGQPLLLEHIHPVRQNTWILLKPWAAFFGLMFFLCVLGILAWLLRKKIFSKSLMDPDSARALKPVDAYGYLGLWVLFRLVWSGLFPIFQIEDSLLLVLMDYIPQVFLGLFLVHRVCVRLELKWAAFGLLYPRTLAHLATVFAFSILVFAMALPLVYAGQLVSTYFWDSIDPMAPIILRIFEDGRMLQFGLVSVVLAPIFEEILFRGFLYGSLRARYDAKVANWMQAFTFALLHFNPLAFLPLLLLGFVIGKARERTGSVLPCIFVHALWNLTVTIITLFLLSGGT